MLAVLDTGHHLSLVAGDKLFVDFAGQTLAVVDPAAGQVRPAQVFVAVLAR
jgi:hypothetical protein